MKTELIKMNKTQHFKNISIYAIVQTLLRKTTLWIRTFMKSDVILVLIQEDLETMKMKKVHNTVWEKKH